MPKFLRGISPLLAASLVTAAGLVLVGWFDYSATRTELLRLLRDQATSLRQTVAAAARSNEMAGAQAERQVVERLLDNARLLVELDRHGFLNASVLNEIAAKNRLFRATVIGPNGSREMWGGPAGGPGGPPAGRGFGGALVQRLLDGREPEAVSELHDARWGGGARIAAGVRRSGGGAIVLNADATDVAALQRQTSLDSLVNDIVASTGGLAYLMVNGRGLSVAHGELPPDSDSSVQPDAVSRPPATPVEREIVVNERPVLDLSGPLELGSTGTAVIRLGLRLDTLRQAERRQAVRVGISLLGALGLALLALWSLWLRKAYGRLSARHQLAEAALRRRDRLTAMGELAATVAHEVRNPLNAIAMSAKRLRREYLEVAPPANEQDREDMGQLLRVVEQETQRINGIVQQFLEFARPPRLVLQRAAPAEIVRLSVRASADYAAAREVTLEETSIDSADLAIDPGQIRQAVDNLVRNAIEATPPGGRVTVAGRSTRESYAIEVRDTGPGIDADTLPKIFDLYFTTKANGSGVGLAVTQHIVSAHGGTIEVESAPGAGTCMVLRLPVSRPEVGRV